MTDTASARRAAELAWGPLISRIDEVSRQLSDDEGDVVCRFLTQVTEVSAGNAREDNAAR